MIQPTGTTAPGFNAHGTVIHDRLVAEAIRKRNAHPRFLASVRARWHRHARAVVNAGFKPTPVNPVPLGPFMARHATPLITRWLSAVFMLDIDRLHLAERPGLGPHDYNTVVDYTFTPDELTVMERAMAGPGTTRDMTVDRATIKIC